MWCYFMRGIQKVHEKYALCLFLKDFIYWSKNQNYGERERQRDRIFHLLVPSPDRHNNQHCARSKPGARDLFQVSYVCTGPQTLESFSDGFSRSLTRSWIISRAAKKWTGTHLGCWVAGSGFTSFVSAGPITFFLNLIFKCLYLFKGNKFDFIYSFMGIMILPTLPSLSFSLSNK